MGIEQDAAITYNVTLEISSAITECAMVPSHNQVTHTVGRSLMLYWGVSLESPLARALAQY